MLDELLEIVLENKGSDLHLIEGLSPSMRVDGKIYRIKPPDFENGNKLAEQILTDRQRKILEERGDVDAAYNPQTLNIQTRVNVYRDSTGISFAFRLIPDKIPSMDDLMFPISMRNMTKEMHGLILVTGPTGSGKTTTLAAMLQSIADNRYGNIVTLEDPIEYELRPSLSIISQREVGRHCDSFASGLKAALRQDPDVIMVGELRDAETIGTALAAAETGHLVLATLHTATVVEAVDRMTQYFPPADRKAILTELANSFIGIVAQRLFEKKKGGRVAAYEILTRTTATVNMIRSDAIFRCADYMRPEHGMQTMEKAIQGLQNLGLI
ncbi:MAG: PilT/PilU family type 4a pilus ATPase [Schwartzia sp.]|nr:PilT/PilU family type 4a pilus ATPase [Schwartzia sp. (in: firmicutes)]